MLLNLADILLHLLSQKEKDAGSLMERDKIGHPYLAVVLVD